jgi:hypothetical protein
VSEFTIQIISGKNIMIGFCPIDQFKQNGTIFGQNNVCFFQSYSGDVYYNGALAKSYGCKLKTNDKLTAIKIGTSIRFLKNGMDLGKAINDADGEMYPIVEFCDVGDSVMIVPNP